MTRARDLAAGTFELATGGVLKLETSDTTVTDGSVLGKIEFKAPDEASGTDAILVGAAIEAVAEGTFAADNNATELVFKTGASAAADAKMTLTSGGNLLVGKTVAGDTGAGITIQGIGKISAVRDGGIAAKFVRETSDGSIVEFVKDTTTVGSIGAKSGDIYIGTGDTGIRFNDGDNAVYAANTTTGGASDGNISLGVSAARFKDLYLSGGVYLGGTGAANKLEDYEEGTWTPVFADATSGGNTVTSSSGIRGVYTKIGNMVTVNCSSSNLDTTGMTTGNDLHIQGLPFTPTSYTSPNQIYAGATQIGFVAFSTSGFVQAYALDNATYVRLGESINGGTLDVITVGQLTSGSADIKFTITYFTSA
jgi:hypothetical protein